jgi:hypothetical protein
MPDAEGTDEKKTVASHLQGGILVNMRQSVKASVANLKDRIYKRNGMIVAAESNVGRKALRCECYSPCGYRYFPAVFRLKDLQMSDVEKLLRRVYTETEIEQFALWLQERNRLNERMRASGALRRNDEMFMGRVPGVLVRGLCHDFPDEFSTREGGTVEVQHYNLEKFLSVFFVNRDYRQAVRA